MAANSPDGRPKGRREWVQNLFFSREFILLIFGAIITSFLIPYIFQQSQNHQKELEIKANMIKQISESTMNPIALAQIFEGEKRNDSSIVFSRPSNVTLTNQRIEILKTGAVIKSQILSYFPETDIARSWDNITGAVYNFLRLFPEDNIENRRYIIVEAIYPNLVIYINKSTVDGLSNRSSSNYTDAYFELQNDIVKQQDKLVRMILNTPISAYK
jgi:hypothetical protein